jgi:glucose dehydrogenase
VQQFGPAGGAIWSAPTIDDATNTIYATTGDSYSKPAQDTSDAFVAFDSTTGKLKWSRQMTEGDAYNVACTSQYRANCPDKKGPDFDFGSSAILVALADGKRALIAGQKSGMVHALDPDHDARSCGSAGSARAPRSAACNGAWRSTTRTSTSPCRISASKEWRRARQGPRKPSWAAS